jgi:hypothetical protein
MRHIEPQAHRLTEPRYQQFFKRGGPEKPGSSVGIGALKINQTEDALLILLITLLTFTTFLILFTFRSFDDNRLTSWQWVFADIDIIRMLLILLVAVVLAYALSMASVIERKPAAVLFGSSFIVAGIFWGEPEVIVDASRYFVQAKYLELYGIGYFVREWGKEIMVWTDLPLVPLLYGLIFDVFGEARMAIQMFVALLFSATVVLTYLIGKTLWDESVGIYGGMLLLAMPYLLTQVPLMLVDVPAMFFLTLAVFVTIKAVRQGGLLLLLASSVAIMLASLSKYSNWLMLSVFPVILLSHFESGWKIILRRGATIALATTCLMGMVMLWKFDVFAEQLALLQSYQLPGLQRWQESFTSTFFFQIHPFITLAALYSIYRAIRRKDPTYAIVGWMLLLVILLEIKRIRYTVVVFPMLALMAAYGFREVRNLAIGKFAVSCAVVSSLVVAVAGYLPFLQKTSAVNLKTAGEYLNSIDGATVEVHVLPQLRSSINPAVSVPILDYFTNKEVAYQSDMGLNPRPGQEVIETSPLRFTWAYKHPPYFSAKRANVDTPVAVILSDSNQSLPSHIARRLGAYRLDKELNTSDRLFRYKTIVQVYQPI